MIIDGVKSPDCLEKPATLPTGGASRQTRLRRISPRYYCTFGAAQRAQMMVAPPRQNRSTEARLGARIQQLEQCLEAALERIDRMEPVPRAPVMDAPLLADIMEGVRARVDELHVLVAEDLLSFEKSLQAQAVAIDSARTAAAQTDDLVERVVEAVESLSSR